MQLSQEIKDKAKVNAGKTSCVLWVICGLYCIYSLQHVKLFSLFSLVYFTIGIFVAPLTFGVLLYFVKSIIFYLSTPPMEEPRTDTMKMFWLAIIVVTTFIQWVIGILLAYPMYITAKFLFTNYYF